MQYNKDIHLGAGGAVVNGYLIDEHACAVLALSTRAAWSPDLPPPLSASTVRRMIACGALKGLVLNERAGMEEKVIVQARALLSRVKAVYACLQAYEIAGYRLLMPGRENWPGALHVLGTQEPLFLFARGNLALLDGAKTAVAGSRHILSRTRKAAYLAGQMIAREGRTLVSGGARGVDIAAQLGAWHESGGVILVPALPVAALLADEAVAGALEENRLLLLCDTLPDEPFSAQKALRRNHVIYALGDTALVIAARDGVGGSWHGAADCLRAGWRRVYVWDAQNGDTLGNRALQKRGALPCTIDGQTPLGEQMTAHDQMCMPL